MKVSVIGMLRLWLYGVKVVVNGKEAVSTAVEMGTSNKVAGAEGGGGLMVKVLSKSII